MSSPHGELQHHNSSKDAIFCQPKIEKPYLRGDKARDDEKGNLVPRPNPVEPGGDGGRGVVHERVSPGNQD
jgi:hypothetical protein